MSIPGDIGFVVKIGLFTGLREEELYYIHDKEVCNNELGCRNLQLDNRRTIIGINWVRTNKNRLLLFCQLIFGKSLGCF
jgi:hypothetical protein